MPNFHRHARPGIMPHDSATALANERMRDKLYDELSGAEVDETKWVNQS